MPVSLQSGSVTNPVVVIAAPNPVLTLSPTSVNYDAVNKQTINFGITAGAAGLSFTIVLVTSGGFSHNDATGTLDAMGAASGSFQDVFDVSNGTFTVTAVFSDGTKSNSVAIKIGVAPMLVATTMTLSIPPNVVAGTSFTVSGRLTRNDTGAGVPSATISVSVASGTPTNVTTDASGNYTASLTAPTAPGSYPVKASFAGMVTASGIFQPSSITAGGSSPPDATAVVVVLAIGGIITGAVLLGRHRKRKR